MSVWSFTMTGNARSTAETRRRAVVRSALEVFARSGYTTSPVTLVAERAGISPAYVMKLFPRKIDLFVAAIDECYERIATALDGAADQAAGAGTAATLDAMGARYAGLIADRQLLLLQVQALAATQVDEVAEAVRRGTGRITTLVMSRSGATTRQTQDFLARGQLCHLLTAIDAFGTDTDWARTLTEGFRHSPPA